MSDGDKWKRIRGMESGWECYPKQGGQGIFMRQQTWLMWKEWKGEPWRAGGRPFQVEGTASVSALMWEHP